MTEAVIVSTARTPIGKAYKGALNNTEGATLLGHAISAALSRANVEGAEVEDVVMGCAMQQGTTGTNIARKALLRAGLPVSVAGTTIDRQCASGLQAIALAAPFGDFRWRGGCHRRRRRIHQPGPEQPVQQFSCRRSRTAGDERGRLHRDAGYCRNRSETLQYLARTSGRIRPREPAPDGRSPAGRPLQRRTRSDQDHHGGHGQGDRCRVVSASDAVGRRRAASRYHGRGSCWPQAGKGTGLHCYRRECEPAVGRRQCHRHHERQAGRTEGIKATRYLPRLCRSGLRA